MGLDLTAPDDFSVPIDSQNKTLPVKTHRIDLHQGYDLADGGSIGDRSWA